MRKGNRVRRIAVVTFAVLFGLTVSAPAKTIHVRAKNPNALAKKIDRANSGDRLVVHKGIYRGPLQIDKQLRIVGKKKKGKRTRKAVIENGCGTPTGVSVTADGVSLRGLKLRGGGFFTLDMTQIDTGKARQLRLIDSCDALYGINVFQSGALQLVQNRPTGYLDAGIYVGGIEDTGTGTLRVNDNDSFGNNRGLIVEDSFPPASILVDYNQFHDNTLPGEGDPAGIFVHNSDGVTFHENVVDENGVYGIHLDAGSSSNRLFDNLFRLNGVDNVRNEGAGNCGTGNSPNEFDPC